MIHRMLKDEGLFLGGSSGINICGAIKMPKKMGPGHNILLCYVIQDKGINQKFGIKTF